MSKLKQNMTKNEWLQQRSELFAKYAKGLPRVYQNVRIQFDKPEYGWINTYFLVNGEEKGYIELSSVYEPFTDIKEWLEDIVKKDSEHRHGISMVEIDCEKYGVALYYEPIVMMGNTWNGLNPGQEWNTGIFYVFDGSTNTVWADAYCKTASLVKGIYESIINYAIKMHEVEEFVENWVWDEMDEFEPNSPKLKDFFLNKVRSTIVEEYIRYGVEPRYVRIK